MRHLSIIFGVSNLSSPLNFCVLKRELLKYCWNDPGGDVAIDVTVELGGSGVYASGCVPAVGLGAVVTQYNAMDPGAPEALSHDIVTR